MGQQMILNGKMSSVAPDEAVTANRLARNRPLGLNGLAPVGVAINGLSRPPVPSDCVLYLPLHHSALSPAGFASLDASGHACTVTGAIWTPHGRSLDGVDDFVDVGNPAVLQVVNDFTVEAWVNLAATQGDFIVPISHGHNSTQGWTWQAAFDNNLPALFGDGVNIAGPSWGDLRGLGWQHLAAVKSASGASIYRNGAWVDTDFTRTADVVLAGANLTVGRDPSLARYMKGVVGEVRVYSRALGADELLRGYQATRWRYQ